MELSERLAAEPPAERWVRLAALPAEELRPLAFQEVETRRLVQELTRENRRLQGLVAPAQAPGAREAALLRQLASADRREAALREELAALRDELADTKEAPAAAPAAAPSVRPPATSVRSRSDSQVVASLLAQSALRNFSSGRWTSFTDSAEPQSSTEELFARGISLVDAVPLETSTGSDAEAAGESDRLRAELAETRQELQAAAAAAEGDRSPRQRAPTLSPLPDSSWRRRHRGCSADEAGGHHEQLEIERKQRMGVERRLQHFEAGIEGGSTSSFVEASEAREHLSELSGMLEEVRVLRSELAAPTALRAEAAAAAAPVDARRRIYGAVFAALVAGPEVGDVEQWLQPSLEAAVAAERAKDLRHEVAEVRELRAELRAPALKTILKSRASSWKSSSQSSRHMTIATDGDLEEDPAMPRSSLCDGYDALSNVGIEQRSDRCDTGD